MSTPPRLHPGLAFLILAVALGAAAFILIHAHPAPGEAATGTTKSFWEERIRTVGGKAAMQEFEKRNAAPATAGQHLQAHIMGEALYAVLGLDGLPFCTAAFGFGCYHGYFGRAIAAEGSDVVAELDGKCVEAYGPWGAGCQHGIGHGVLEYEGYAKLADALLLCKQTTQKAPMLGCISGVFMEYNAPLVTNEDGSVPEPRVLDTLHPYAPCDSVSPETRESCYFELGAWYRNTSGNAPDKIAAFCKGLTATDRSRCFMGAGGDQGVINANDVPASLRICEPLTGEDEVSCRAGVSWGYRSSGHTEEAVRACDTGDAVSTASCGTLGDLTNGLVPLP